jgi:hypothetical protein
MDVRACTPPTNGNARPNGFDNAKRPSTLQRAVDGRRCTGASEEQHERWRALFSGIEHQHRGGGEYAEQGQRVDRRLHTAGTLSSSKKVSGI